ncbi:hypothetical protein Nmel_016261, partial [Mimus melanotis]
MGEDSPVGLQTPWLSSTLCPW